MYRLLEIEISMYEIAILQHFTVFEAENACQVLLVINIFFSKYWVFSFFHVILDLVNIVIAYIILYAQRFSAKQFYVSS